MDRGETRRKAAATDISIELTTTASPVNNKSGDTRGRKWSHTDGFPTTQKKEFINHTSTHIGLLSSSLNWSIGSPRQILSEPFISHQMVEIEPHLLISAKFGQL